MSGKTEAANGVHGAGSPADAATTHEPGLLGDVGAIMGRRALGLLMGAGTSVITARALGAAGRGELAVAGLWVGLFGLVLPMSIGYGFIYYIGQRKLSLSEALSNGLTFSLVVGVIGALLACVAGILWAGQVIRGVWTLSLVVAAIGLPAGLFGETAGLCLTGAGLIRLSARVGAITSTTRLALCALLVLGVRWGVVGALLAFTINNYVGSALIFLMVGRQARIRPALDLAAIVSAVRFSVKLHFGFIAQFLNYRLDQFVVNFFLGPAAVGIYGVAVTLAELIWHVPGAVGNALYPRTSSTRSDSAELTARACRMTMLVVGLACVVAAVAGPPLIPLVFGAEFASAGPVLWALLPGVLALSAGKVVGPYLVGHDRPQALTWGSVAALLLTVGMGLLLIPQLGILGAGLVSSAAYSGKAAVSLLWYMRTARAPLAAAVLPRRRDITYLGSVWRPRSALRGTASPK